MTRQEWRSRRGRSSKWIRKTTRVAIYLRDGFRCLYCGRDLRAAGPREIGLDHLLPRYRDGSNEPRNLITVCHSCNATRKKKPWRRFATPAAVKRIERQRRRPLNRELARMIVSGEAPWPDGSGDAQKGTTP